MNKIVTVSESRTVTAHGIFNMIDIKEYVRRIEEEQRKKAEQKRGNGR